MDSARDQPGAVYPKPRLTPRAAEFRIQDVVDLALLRSGGGRARSAAGVVTRATEAGRILRIRFALGATVARGLSALYAKRPT